MILRLGYFCIPYSALAPFTTFSLSLTDNPT